ncbi:fimbrial biogenesis chaperone [Roseisolibacter agri]|uniref:Pili assembly chaperone N-terminal domain-containing protein n=1 Tax=Roseisolibacter agri TaxID=2014610 RepID=A0AA37QID4_9BACT|nr:hypothetical protein [Roseisolibacter agri]GLC27060.1 hypothetical protein rosag_35730 [Roseisolibacter agri]
MTPLPFPSARRLLALAGLALGASRPAAAQLGVDRSEILMRPAIAAERVGVITVRNVSDRPVQAVVKTEDWDRADDGANRWLPVGSVKGSCGSALTVFPLSVNLDAGASQSIRLVAHDSLATLPRECWSAVVLETVQPPGKNGVSYVIRTAVKVYVEPAGLRAAGEVTAMHVRAGAADADSLEVWFRNSGERHYVARGTVEFRRADNSVAATVELPDYYVLPGARQRALVAMPKLPAGDYLVLSMVDYGGDEIAAMQLEHTVPTPSAPTKAAGK